MNWVEGRGGKPWGPGGRWQSMKLTLNIFLDHFSGGQFVVSHITLRDVHFCTHLSASPFVPMPTPPHISDYERRDRPMHKFLLGLGKLRKRGTACTMCTPRLVVGKSLLFRPSNLRVRCAFVAPRTDIDRSA